MSESLKSRSGKPKAKAFLILTPTPQSVIMIDISEKAISKRVAIACGSIILKVETIEAIKSKQIEKGDTLEVARIAAITAVKYTPTLVPMCHPIPIDAVSIAFIVGADRITVDATVKSTGKTGVEMEAITAASVALLNIWDMVKYLEKDGDGQYPETRIVDVRVVKKEKIKSAV